MDAVARAVADAKDNGDDNNEDNKNNDNDNQKNQNDNSVIVLCPYVAQGRRVLARGLGVPVHTIDSFQGREADTVVLTLVRDGSAGLGSGRTTAASWWRSCARRPSSSCPTGTPRDGRCRK